MTAEKVSIVVGSEPVELPESNGKHPGLTSLEIFYCAAERRLEETNATDAALFVRPRAVARVARRDSARRVLARARSER